MDERDDDLFEEEPLDLFEQDGPDLFGGPDESAVDEPLESGSAEPPVEDPPLDAVDAQAVEVGPHRRSEEEVTASLMEVVDALRQPSGTVSRPETPLALYRRYRPDTFGDVIGQEHVTEPLQRALVNNRVNHAYLFSGPRGCGKTTSARILARALNCESGPTPVPCGKCRSCRDLARGGSGSIDVIEIDAASHGGVDEARDLRERAFFAPVHSRYKIYIIDEAHMVTNAGFNALLKVVEEPPAHVKFIFATTEPEKVIGTIRSRTHHYPFRLVPPKTLSAYLATLCEAEGIAVESAVLPLVVRAGAGSVRDSLSVLDQLLGGAGEAGVSYRQATALLGYTPDALLDEIVDAFAAGDSRGVFAAVDKVIEVGQDPRRFAEDLLRRLRDLIIVAAVPEALSSGLVDVSGDQAERLLVQANAMGAGELTRAAEVIAVGLTEMRGTTAPRLHLELMCARVLLPGADAGGRGVHARLDRLERRLSMGAPDQPSDTATPRASRPDPRPIPEKAAQRPAPQTVPEKVAQRATPQTVPEEVALRPSRRAADASEIAATPIAKPATDTSEAAALRDVSLASSRASSGTDTGDTPQTVPEEAGQRPTPQTAPEEIAQPATPQTVPEEVALRPSRRAADTTSLVGDIPDEPAETPAPTVGDEVTETGGIGTTDVRRFWPQILDNVKNRRRFTWILLSQNAQVVEVREGVLTLGLSNGGVREGFARGGNADVLREAILEVLGAALHINPIIDSTADGQVGQPAANVPARSQAPTPDAALTSPASPQRSAAAEAARANLRPTRKVEAATAEQPEPEPSRDDEVIDETSTTSSEDLLMKHLGAELLAEEDN